MGKSNDVETSPKGGKAPYIVRYTYNVMFYCLTSGAGGVSFTRQQFALIIAASMIPSLIVPLALPAVKESVESFFYRSHNMEGYLGDEILIGDTETYYIPFSTVNWVVSLSPEHGNSYHTVSIYVVPAHIARESMRRFRRTYVSNTFQVTEGKRTHSLGMRSYVYLLPKKYIRDEHVAKIEYEAYVTTGVGDEPIGTTVFWFQNRQDFTDFIEKEPGASERASGCKCLVSDVVSQKCSKNDDKCIDKVKKEAHCTDVCHNGDPYFTAENSSYNYYAFHAPKDSRVQYNTTIDMFFYDHTKLGKYRKCIIRGSDDCPVMTQGYSLFPRERELVIAYIHPTSVPSFTTTRLLIQSEVRLDSAKWLILMILGVVAIIVKHCLQGKVCG